MKKQAIEIQKWCVETFGEVIDWDLYISRIIEELQELRTSISEGDRINEAEEFSDVFILLLRAVIERGIDIETAIDDKMVINKNRKWSSVDGIGRSIK